MKTKKYVIYFFLAFSCLINHAQEIKDRHIQKLETLGIEYKTEYFFDKQATKDLHQIIRFDHKRKAKQTVGTILFSVGLGSIIGGLVQKSKAYDASDGFGGLGSGLLLTAGIAEFGASIPFLISANKSTKSRDRLKKPYEMETTLAEQAKFIRDSQTQNLSRDK